MSDPGISGTTDSLPPTTTTPAPEVPPEPPEPSKLPQWHMLLESAVIPKDAVLDKDNPDIPTDNVMLATISIAISLTKIADAYQRQLGLK